MGRLALAVYSNKQVAAVSKEEAEEFIKYGRWWLVDVWGNKVNPTVKRAEILENLNTKLNQHGIWFRTSVFQNYEHIVHVKDAPLTYSSIAKSPFENGSLVGDTAE